jgi:ketosteroid isomerase-like protein
MKRRPNSVAAIVMIAYGAYGPAPAAAGDFTAEMNAENARWLAVYESQDAQAFGPMYASDAIVLPQGGPPIQGRTAIVQFWFEMLRNDSAIRP